MQVVSVVIKVGTRRKWSGSRNGHFTLGTHCVGGWEILSASLDSLENRIIPCFCPESNHDYSAGKKKKRKKEKKKKKRKTQYLGVKYSVKLFVSRTYRMFHDFRS